MDATKYWFAESQIDWMFIQKHRNRKGGGHEVYQGVASKAKLIHAVLTHSRQRYLDRDLNHEKLYWDPKVVSFAQAGFFKFDMQLPSIHLVSINGTKPE